VGDRVHRLVAFDAEDRGAEYLLRIGIDHHLDETVRLAALGRATDAGHRTLADEDTASARPRLRLGHTDATERWIDEEPVDRDAIGHASLVAIEEIRGDDLVVIVRGMRKRPAPIAVACRPHVRRARAELVVDADIAMSIELDAGAIRAE